MRFPDPPRKPANSENMVPLINIVFLILIFFLVAATIRPFSDDAVRIATSLDAEAGGSTGARILIVREDGTIRAGGAVLDAQAVAQQLAAWAQDSASKAAPVTLVADHRAKASRVVELAAQASTAGITNVRLLTRKQTPG